MHIALAANGTPGILASRNLPPFVAFPGLFAQVEVFRVDMNHAIGKLASGFNVAFAKDLLKIGEVDVDPEIGFVD